MDLWKVLPSGGATRSGQNSAGLLELLWRRTSTTSHWQREIRKLGEFSKCSNRKQSYRGLISVRRSDLIHNMTRVCRQQ